MEMNKLQKLYKGFLAQVPDPVQATVLMRGFGLWKIPLLFAVSPTVLEINNKRAVVRVPLSRKTKNHLGSMYFGALAIGADTVVGVLAMRHMKKRKIHLSFKDFHADFLRRPEGDVHFICEEGESIAKFIEEVCESGERKNLAIPAYAIVPSQKNEVVAKFTLTLSLKRKS